MEKVTIIIPMYNSENYILNCLKAIKNQTYKEIKVILVDDGSNDNTIEVCKEFIEKNNIKYIDILSKKNGGASSARNYGLKYVETEYVCFVDSDDIINKDYVEILMKNKNDFVIAGYIEKKKFIEKPINLVSEKKNVRDDDLYKLIFKVPLINFLNPPYCKLYKNSIIKKNHITFDENLKIGEDLKFNLTYLEMCKSVTFLPDNIYLYTDTNINSLTTQFNDNRWKIELDLFTIYENYFKKNNSYNRYEKEINEFLLSSFAKTCYTLLKSNKLKMYKINYLKSMIKDEIFNNKSFSFKKFSNKIVFVSIKIKCYLPVYLFYKLKILYEKII